MIDNNKIKKLIEDSCITLEKKRCLLQYIELKGVDMRFFATFNDYLVETTKQKGEEYKQTIKKIDDLQVELDKRITIEKSVIEKRLDEELEDLDPEDTKTKDRIWKEYYDTLDELGARYDKGLKDILAKILANTQHI